MKLTALKTEKANIEEIQLDEFVVHNNRLAVIVEIDIAFGSFALQYLDDLDTTPSFHLDADTLFDRVLSATIEQPCLLV